MCLHAVKHILHYNMIQCVDRPTDVRNGTATVQVTVCAKLCSGEHEMIDRFVV